MNYLHALICKHVLYVGVIYCFMMSLINVLVLCQHYTIAHRASIHGDAWVETHGKFCASRRMSFCLCARVLNDARCGLRDPPLITQDIWSSFTTQRMSVYLFEWRMSRKSVSSMRDTEPTPWHLKRKMQNITHAQRL